MFGLFPRRPILGDTSTEWLFNTYAWALQNFDARVFFHETILVTPTNDHFPGRADSVHGMASLIFDQVRSYAGVTHWPCRLAPPEVSVHSNPQLVLEGPVRGSQALVSTGAEEANILNIPYNPNQVLKPEALIADYAHVLAHYLGTTGSEPPPGGVENWPFATELLAIYMGFGLMFANSAYSYRGSCGSCYNPLAERTAYLSQDEATYALAIFCVLKDIPKQKVLGELKNYLRPVFKRALREVVDRPADVARLMALKV